MTCIVYKNFFYFGKIVLVQIDIVVKEKDDVTHTLADAVIALQGQAGLGMKITHKERQFSCTEILFQLFLIRRIDDDQLIGLAGLRCDGWQGLRKIVEAIAGADDNGDFHDARGDCHLTPFRRFLYALL